MHVNFSKLVVKFPDITKEMTYFSNRRQYIIKSTLV